MEVIFSVLLQCEPMGILWDFLCSFTFASLGACVFYILIFSLFFKKARDPFLLLLAPPLSSTKSYYACFDSFRGIAALWVALFHLWQWTKSFTAFGECLPVVKIGYNGVPLFCILSGFLIYRSVQRIGDIESLKKYIFRRFLRIYPLFFVTSTVCFFFVDVDVAALIRQFLMFNIFGGGGIFNPPSWSLFVEVAYYIILPLFFFSFGGRSKLISLLIFVLLAVVDRDSSTTIRLWKYFFLGMVCSDVVSYLQEKTRVASILFPIGLIAISFACYSALSPGWLGRQEQDVVFAVGFGLVLISVCINERVACLFSFRPLRIVGAFSYSLYLWHSLLIMISFPNLEFLTNGAVTGGRGGDDLSYMIPIIFIPALLLFSLFSYLLIERPFLKLRTI